VVHVDDAGSRGGFLHNLVGVADGGQPGAEVDELADALFCDPSGGALVESAVRPCPVLHLGDQRADVLRGVAVGLVVVRAAEDVVIHPRRARDCRVHPGGNLLDHLLSL
jgi:hypothetical protein